MSYKYKCVGCTLEFETADFVDPLRCPRCFRFVHPVQDLEPKDKK